MNARLLLIPAVLLLSGCSILNHTWGSAMAHPCDEYTQDCSIKPATTPLHVQSVALLERSRQNMQPATLSPYAVGPAYPVLSPIVTITPLGPLRPVGEGR